MPGKPNHNARSCPKLEVGAQQIADTIEMGVAEAGVVAILTSACLPVGLMVGGAFLAKMAYQMAMRELQQD